VPRKRRPGRPRRLPDTLAGISLMERAWWQGHGPLLESDGVETIPGYTVWPSWAEWASFYGAVRSGLYGDRPWLLESSAAEQLYVGIVAGDDPETVRAQLEAMHRHTDPRSALGR
jgi:hypothetical protein